MRVPRKPALMVLLIMTAFVAALPGNAGQPAANKAKVPDVFVVIDREANLALVPEGTVVPAGLEISVPVAQADKRADRRLVFAYAAEERFNALREFRARFDAGELRGTIQRGHDLVSQVGVSSDSAASAVVPGGVLGSTTSVCPVQLWVEPGPGVHYTYECHKPHWGPYKWWIDFTIEQDTDMSTRMILGYHWSRDGRSGYTVYPSWLIDDTVWTSYSWNPDWVLDNIFSLYTREAGPCTQDPPYCPPSYSTTLKFLF
jgi:hypothetical protein